MVPQPSLALIGAGYWGKNLARNFSALGVLHTLCDQSSAILASYGEEYAAVSKLDSVDDVWLNSAITKVAIAAPAVFHFSLAKAALLAGKDVFVEKPLCLEETGARELAALAERTGRVLMVGHLLQYHPLVQKLQHMVAQGELGKLQYITSNRLNLGKIRREENALWSFAPHDISVILTLAGNHLPEQVRCTGGEYLNSTVADTTLTALRFPGGLRAHVYVSWLNPFKEQKLTVVGSQGMAVFDDTRPWNEKLQIYRHYLTWANGQVPTPNKATAEAVVVPEAEPLREECQHFLTCCQNRQTPRTDAREGLRVLQVLQMAQASLDQDGEAAGSAVGSQRTIDEGQRTEDGGPISRLNEYRSVSGPRSPTFRPPTADFFVHPTAVVDEGAVIGQGTKIWHFSHVMKGAQIGERCVFGQNVNVDGGTLIGNNVKVQNNVSIYTGVEIEDDVFLGPSCVLTNVTNPRSQVNRHSLYEKTFIRRGATVGANATIVCGVTIGRFAFIGAGAVVTKDVPDYALMVGNPARQKGWMSRHGHVLNSPDPDGIMTCPESGYRYRISLGLGDACPPPSGRLVAAALHCLDIDEKSPLPASMAKGHKTYRSFKASVQ